MEMADMCIHGEQPPKVGKDFKMRALEDWIPHPALKRYWHRQRVCIAQGRQALQPRDSRGQSALPWWIPELNLEVPQEEVLVKLEACPGLRCEVLPQDLQGMTLLEHGGVQEAANVVFFDKWPAGC